MNKQKRIGMINSIVIDYIIPAFISVGTAIILFERAVLISSINKFSYRTFFSLTRGLDNYYNFITAWKPRLFSTFLASFAGRVSNWLLAKTSVPIAKDVLELTIGLWTSGWFLLTCFILIIFLKRRALFYVIGMCIGILYGYLTGMEWPALVYPWDMPALFFFTLFVLLFINKKYWWLFAMIPLSVGFKETGLVFCLAFLFADLPWKQRLLMLGGAFVLSMGVKIVIDLYVHAPLFLTMEYRTDDHILIFGNFPKFIGFFPWFINAGTLIAFLILPNLNKNIYFLKLIAIPFILGIMLFGNILEYRVWFEMIPFSLYALDVAINGDLQKNRMVSTYA